MYLYLQKHLTSIIFTKVKYKKCFSVPIRNICSQYELDLRVNNISLNKFLKNLENEYDTLEKDLTNKSRLIELQPLINTLNQRKTIVKNLSQLKELLQDKDSTIRQLAEDEKVEFVNKLNLIDEELLEILLPVDKEDSCSSMVLEINSGVGGQEAMLFAAEIFDMYCNFAMYKGWDYQIAEYLTNDVGGLRHGSLLLNGKSVYSYFKYEAGVHRVQRIPVTEKSGRIHTSTISVLALPQPDDIEVEIQNKDLKIETKRASGAGGQHVNTTDSAVRILHIPSGIAVECQVDRSQIKNKEFALQRLKAKLYQMELDKQLAEIEATKKSQVRTNFRNEKIRTYNFSQDRITDHRLESGKIHNLKTFMDGGEPLELLIKKLHRQYRIEKLLNMVETK